MTPLCRAALNGKLQMVQLLCGLGADINRRDHWGRAPIRAAAAMGHAVVVEFLAAYGANVNLPDSVCIGLLAWACAHVSLPTCLHTCMSMSMRLLFAAALICLPGFPLSFTTRALLTGHCSLPLHCTQSGCSALFVAARWGHVDTGRVLLARNASIEQPALLLLSDGANLHKTPAREELHTPLWAAEAHGHVAVAQMLRVYGSAATPAGVVAAALPQVG